MGSAILYRGVEHITEVFNIPLDSAGINLSCTGDLIGIGVAALPDDLVYKKKAAVAYFMFLSVGVLAVPFTAPSFCGIVAFSPVIMPLP
ncbi:hypothetical protein AGMMS4952_24720 [Spirochaetia bacterium]|nr:hypothetical protein AGMMS4952_24720 [Spirochaetia bacterium]